MAKEVEIVKEEIKVKLLREFHLAIGGLLDNETVILDSLTDVLEYVPKTRNNTILYGCKRRFYICDKN